MQTALLTGLARLDLRDTPAPALHQPDEVLLRIGAVGVCGSDIHYYRHGRIGSQVVAYPFTVGHECGGSIVQLGAAVRHLTVGQRVAVDPAIICGTCDQCLAGRHHTCRNLRYLGCPGQLEGCLSEYLVMPAACCIPVPETLDHAQVALLEPLSIACYAVRLAGVTPGTPLAILGAGPIGLCVLAAARALGAGPIMVSEPLAYRRQAALAMGATWVGEPSDDLPATIQGLAPQLLPLVFECCGQQEALDQGVELLAPGGKLMIIGIPETARVSFNIDLLRRREICLQNVRRQNGCIQIAIDLIEAHPDWLAPMITHHFPLSRCREAFDLVADYRDGVIKAMVYPDLV
jgi:L-iditol 2-dehydrogenase